MSPDYILLAGAKKNVGDFLIGERGRSLLAHFRPDRSFETWDRFQAIDDRLDEVNAARAVILLGGPAYAADFYPGIYPLARDLLSIRVPIVPLALGWSGRPDGDPEAFQFSSSSQVALEWISRRSALSCRDSVTEGILRRHGFDDVVMTGCTAWHHLPSHGVPFRPPQEIRKVVFTPGADRRLYRQNVQLMKVLRELFPDSERYCVFHRGVRWDRHTGPRGAFYAYRTMFNAKRLGFAVVNAGYDLSQLDFYQDCDLHVGYRVHGHLYFLSLRKPSFLLQEDGRGVGVTETLGTPDVFAFRDEAVAILEARIREELDDGFPSFAGLGRKLDGARERMKDFLEALP